MKAKYKLAFLDMAIRFGQTSEATRLKVGALLVKNGGIISEGCNGQPAGWPTEVCEGPDGQTLPTVRHAEKAALDKMRNKTETCEGSTMFVSHAPCLPCSIEIVASGVKEVIYAVDYRSQDGVNYLRSRGVKVTKKEELL